MPLPTMPINYRSSAYGRVPSLQTPEALQSQVSDVVNRAIPGYGGLSQQASRFIGQLMSGVLPSDVQDQIQTKGAEFGVSSGMPGSGLATAKTLRDLGLASLQTQQQGFGDLLNFLQGSSGTAALTPAQIAEQENARSQYAAAPDPTAAARAQIENYKNLYNWQQQEEQRPWWEMPDPNEQAWNQAAWTY